MSNNNIYYEIAVEDLKYGKFHKQEIPSSSNYADVRDEYKKVQNKLKDVKCTVNLNKVIVDEETGKKTRINHYSRSLGTENFEQKLKELATILEELSNMKQFHKEASYENTDLFNDIRHAIEIGQANQLTPEQCKQAFIGLNNRAIIRRASKHEMEKYNACNDSLNIIRTHLNRCFEHCKRLETIGSSSKCVSNGNKADKKYIEALNSLIGG